MKYYLGLIILFFLTGCTTVEFVRKDITPKKQAVVRYSPPSNDKRAAEYKEEVRLQAQKFCGSDFEITREYQALDESRGSVGVGTGFGIGPGSSVLLGTSNRGTTMYNFVEFACK